MKSPLRMTHDELPAITVQFSTILFKGRADELPAIITHLQREATTLSLRICQHELEIHKLQALAKTSPEQADWVRDNQPAFLLKKEQDEEKLLTLILDLNTARIEYNQAMELPPPSAPLSAMTTEYMLFHHL